jgi:hypothetical protein
MAEGHFWINNGRRKSADATNTLACEQHTLTTFQNLILKNNIKLLTAPYNPENNK